MAVIVEDGTGLANANSFTTVAAANAYFSARGNAAWDALDDVDDKAPALIRATDFMEQMFRDRWAGYRQTLAQSLSWPRYEVPIKDFGNGYGFGRGYSFYGAYYPVNVVPALVANACAELALKIASGTELAPDIDRQTSRETVGPITVEYFQGSLPYVQFRAIDQMLLPLFSGTGGPSAKVVRT